MLSPSYLFLLVAAGGFDGFLAVFCLSLDLSLPNPKNTPKTTPYALRISNPYFCWFDLYKITAIA
jgi:hypothetical protein